MKGLQEKDFQNTIQNYLISSGYIKGYNDNFNKTYCIDEKILFEFLEKSQPDDIDYIKKICGTDYKNQIMKSIKDTIYNSNVIEVLRNPIEIEGKFISLAYFKPVTGFNTLTLEQYEKNILSVTDELVYGLNNNNRIDLVTFVNGIPFAVMELKTEITGQSYLNAIIQFQEKRDPDELLFRNSAVFFAIDTNDIYMTTKLEGDKTSFIPFNRGNNNGKGNPEIEGKFATSYLWEDIFKKDSLMEIIKDYNCYDEKSKRLIFPRYHQIDCIRKVRTDILDTMSGNNYLIKHSAGSGKTYTITWLAHTLSKLFKDDKKLFNSIIVITDRKVLDKQLQDSITQIAHKKGVVEAIEENSAELAEAINSDTQIIITTIQKFSYILDKIQKGLKDKKYAVIIDEAHSSQTGKYAENLRDVLNKEETDEDINKDKSKKEIEIEEALKNNGEPSNIQFFALTATPKTYTLEMFGTYDESTKSYKPFHLYSMKQAIEEKFILDVLKNYTTYSMYYKLKNKLLENPLVETKTAKAKITHFIDINSIEEKVPLITEHYLNYIRKEINGAGKAMVVTGSREEALRYKMEMDKYIDTNSLDIKTIVAYTDYVTIDGEKYDEFRANGFKSDEIPERFKSDEYHILIVADKFQTGFDEKRLVGMYVDKSLSGVNAVQTLSRLNRCCQYKDKTFILDFRNDREVIKQAFAEHFLGAEVPDDNYDIDNLNLLKQYIYKSNIVTEHKVKEFIKLFYTLEKDFPKINNLFSQSLDIFNTKDEKKQDIFIRNINRYKNAYEFVRLMQEIENRELSELYAFLCGLIKIIDTNENKKVLSTSISMKNYNLETSIGVLNLGFFKDFDGNLQLTEADIENGAKKIKDGSSRTNSEDYWENIINELNEKSAIKKLEKEFKTETPQIIKELDENEDIAKYSKNPYNDYKEVYKSMFEEVQRTIYRKNRDKAFNSFVTYVRKNNLMEQLTNEIVEMLYNKYHSENKIYKEN